MTNNCHACPAANRISFFEVGKRAASDLMSMIRKQESGAGKNMRQFSYFRVA